ncbi:GntR family transcriptional regulator [Nonomuraea sp. NPDC049480]|uniref:GntR family transcriptional regulator n=1 Tax=Nonomuraea sp. NPDC049480 TaxID=3364353 RepID=UPI0037B2C652
MAERAHAYERIADHLRQKIRSGDLLPGSRLPPHRVMAGEHGVSEIIIRRAVDLLRTEGLVESKRGSGTFVRARPAVRRISMDRYLADKGSQAVPQTSFTRDQGITWSQYRLDKKFAWIETDQRLAGLFDVPVGTRLLERRFVFYASGVPSQMSRSCLLARDVEGTPVADPHNEPWPGGNIGQLRSLGIEINGDIIEETAVRMPTPEEAELLGIGSGVPVFAVTRQMFSNGRVVEVADPIVIPGDRAVRVDRISI